MSLLGAGWEPGCVAGPRSVREGRSREGQERREGEAGAERAGGLGDFFLLNFMKIFDPNYSFFPL